jgi:hypothetical protein
MENGRDALIKKHGIEIINSLVDQIKDNTSLQKVRILINSLY